MSGRVHIATYSNDPVAVKEALFLRNLVGDVLPSVAKTIVLHEDNQSTIKQALNLTASERTKHVDIRHHFLKAHVANGDVRLEYGAKVVTSRIAKTRIWALPQLSINVKLRLMIMVTQIENHSINWFFDTEA